LISIFIWNSLLEDLDILNNDINIFENNKESRRYFTYNIVI